MGRKQRYVDAIDGMLLPTSQLIADSASGSVQLMPVW